MPVSLLIKSILTRRKQTCSMELRNFFKEKKEKPISKQAYFKARQNLNPQVFTYLNDKYLKTFYSSSKEVKTWNDYIILAIDGSKVEIPNSEENRQEYGVLKNHSGTESPARAMVSGLFDVFNKFFIDLQICSVGKSELDAAKENLLAIGRIGITQKAIVIFDRGYPGFEILYYLEKLGLKYIIRLSSNKFKEERKNAKSDDEEIFLKIYDKRLQNVKAKDIKLFEEMRNLEHIKTRLVRQTSPSGEEFAVFTNISQEMNAKEICETYFLRWKIEQAYNTLKNKMKFESVSGNASIYVKQDFLSQILIYNLIEDMITYVEENMLKEEEEKLKYRRKINENMAIGLFSQEAIKIFLEENDKKRLKLTKSLQKEMGNYLLPERLSPSKKRKFLTSNKYASNQKNSF